MTDLDRLMTLDPLNLSTYDIEDIVAFHRQQRALYESGGKTKKLATSGPKPSLDSVINALRPPNTLKPKKSLLDEPLRSAPALTIVPIAPPDPPFSGRKRRTTL